MNSFIESDFGKGFLICLKKPCAPPLACVYAFEMSDDTIKIGVTQDVEERVKSVSRAKCQDVLRIYSTELAPLDFMRIIEARCHATFEDRRERGEYFAITFEEAVAELDKYAEEIAAALHKADRIYLDEVDYYYNVFLPEFNSTYNKPSIILTPQVLSHPKLGLCASSLSTIRRGLWAKTLPPLSATPNLLTQCETTYPTSSNMFAG